MSLLAMERIKFVSTRSPWWCMALAILTSVGFTALFVGLIPAEELGAPIDSASTQVGYLWGQMIIMVMAALAATTEYRFNTIKTTFLAAPNRVKALLAKTAVVAIAGGLVGLVLAFGSWGLSNLLASDADLALNSGADLRAVLGIALNAALTAVFALAVGILIRQSAGAIAIVLIWALLVERILITVIPRVGDDIKNWLPLSNGDWFNAAGLPGGQGYDVGHGPWAALLVFAVWTFGLLTIGLVVTHKRDA
jgi:ABC-2 type transport system permease protein